MRCSALRCRAPLYWQRREYSVALLKCQVGLADVAHPAGRIPTAGLMSGLLVTYSDQDFDAFLLCAPGQDRQAADANLVRGNIAQLAGVHVKEMSCVSGCRAVLAAISPRLVPK